MKSELINTVYKKVSVALSDIYKKRKRTVFFQKVMWAITGLYIILMLLNLSQAYFPNVQFGFLDVFKATAQNPYASVFPIVVLVVLLYPTTFYFTNAFRKYKEKENATITQMVKLLFPNVEFAKGNTTPHEEIANSKIFAWINSKTTVATYGQIRSTINNREVSIADIGFIEENVTNKLSNTLMMIPGLNMLVVFWNYALKNIVTNKTADNVHYTFRGMFVWLVYPKKLNGHTVVLTNTQKLKLDRLASFNFKEEQKVFLEDARFTNKFIVYSTDQVEARYVLSSALMELVVSLEEKFKRDIQLSFHNEKMYLAVENANGLFSFPSGKLDDVKIIEELAKEIETALHISENLKMDSNF